MSAGSALFKAASPCLRTSSVLLPVASSTHLIPSRGHKSIFGRDREGISEESHFKLKFHLNTDKSSYKEDLDYSQNHEIPTPPPTFNHFNPEVKPGEGKEHKWETVPGADGETYEWPIYNKRIYAPDGTYRPAFVTHMRANIKYSPEKMWYVATFMRGKSVDEAFKQLQFIKVKGARVMEEVLAEAQEMALQDHHFEFRSNMWVAEALTDQSKILKTMRRHTGPQGVSMIKHRFCNVYLRLEEGKPPKHLEPYGRQMSPAEQVEKFLDEHRGKRTIVD